MSNSNTKSVTVKQVSNSREYDKFLFIEGNRAIDKNQVKKLMTSFNKHGNAARTIIIIETKSISGKKEYYIADGQHSLQACKNLQIPFDYKIVRLENDTRDNVMKYIATLNNTNKGWGTLVYLNSYKKDNDKPQYKLFADAMATKNGLTITDLLCIFMGDSGNKAMHQFKEGEMNFPNEEKSLKLYKITTKLKSILPTKAFTRRSFYKVMHLSGDYKMMAKAIEEAYTIMDFSNDEAEFYNQLIKIYKNAIKTQKV